MNSVKLAAKRKRFLVSMKKPLFYAGFWTVSINSVKRNTGQLCKLKQLGEECLHRVRGRVARGEVGQGGQEFGRVRDSGS